MQYRKTQRLESLRVFYQVQNSHFTSFRQFENILSERLSIPSEKNFYLNCNCFFLPRIVLSRAIAVVSTTLNILCSICLTSWKAEHCLNIGMLNLNVYACYNVTFISFHLYKKFLHLTYSLVFIYIKLLHQNYLFTYFCDKIWTKRIDRNFPK